LAKGLTNKLLHTPTLRLKEFANESNASQYSEALCDLFDLNSRECD
jgi:glutamyl-tRNA reductase